MLWQVWALRMWVYCYGSYNIRELLFASICLNNSCLLSRLSWQLKQISKMVSETLTRLRAYERIYGFVDCFSASQSFHKVIQAFCSRPTRPCCKLMSLVMFTLIFFVPCFVMSLSCMQVKLFFINWFQFQLCNLCYWEILCMIPYTIMFKVVKIAVWPIHVRQVVQLSTCGRPTACQPRPYDPGQESKLSVWQGDAVVLWIVVFQKVKKRK